MQFHLPTDPAEFEALRQEFYDNGRCSIASILAEEDAETLAAYLEQYDGWARVRGLNKQRFDILPGTDIESDPAVAQDHRQIEHAIASDSGKNFAMLYDAIPMAPQALPAQPATPLVALREAMNRPEVFDWLKRLGEEEQIAGTEIQATRFRAGDFLSTHHDGPNADRKIAMVLGLSRDWSVDWGGNLLFMAGEEGLEGIVPGFNRLDLFAVPQFHCVTAVAPAAPRPRLAISGWFVG